MRSIRFFAFTLVVNVSALQHKFNDWNNPIKVVGTNTDGQGGVERIMHLYAEIYPRHLTTGQRSNFPRSGAIERHFQAIRAEGHTRLMRHLFPFIWFTYVGNLLRFFLYFYRRWTWPSCGVTIFGATNHLQSFTAESSRKSQFRVSIDHCRLVQHGMWSATISSSRWQSLCDMGSWYDIRGWFKSAAGIPFVRCVSERWHRNVLAANLCPHWESILRPGWAILHLQPKMW